MDASLAAGRVQTGIDVARHAAVAHAAVEFVAGALAAARVPPTVPVWFDVVTDPLRLLLLAWWLRGRSRAAAGVLLALHLGETTFSPPPVGATLRAVVAVAFGACYLLGLIATVVYHRTAGARGERPVGARRV